MDVPIFSRSITCSATAPAAQIPIHELKSSIHCQAMKPGIALRINVFCNHKKKGGCLMSSASRSRIETDEAARQTRFRLLRCLLPRGLSLAPPEKLISGLFAVLKQRLMGVAFAQKFTDGA
ncbi:tRNA(Ile)-lysidine synthase [Striga asiatica]|uniref:tRNA(Ile)-lysidine synthase n=1 Tax=Striga asiatica TaxID=4170 RepID=A0A5A7Q1L4_STRAF|nr:tRNA(Ile)-lysidine synthase [Striga asiatica]